MDTLIWSLLPSQLGNPKNAHGTFKLYSLNRTKFRPLDSRSKFVLRRPDCRRSIPAHAEQLEAFAFGKLILTILQVPLKLYIVRYGPWRTKKTTKDLARIILSSLCAIQHPSRLSNFPNHPRSLDEASPHMSYKVDSDIFAAGMATIKRKYDKSFMIIATAYDLKTFATLRAASLAAFGRMMVNVINVFPQRVQVGIDVGSQFKVIPSYGERYQSLIILMDYKVIPAMLGRLFKKVDMFPILFSQEFAGYFCSKPIQSGLVLLRAYHPALEAIATNPLGLVLNQARFGSAPLADIAPNLESYLEKFAKTSYPQQAARVRQAMGLTDGLSVKDRLVEAIILELEAMRNRDWTLRIEVRYDHLNINDMVALHESWLERIRAGIGFCLAPATFLVDVAIGHVKTLTDFAGGALLAGEEPRGGWSRARQLFREAMNDVLSNLCLSYHHGALRQGHAIKHLLGLEQAIQRYNFLSFRFAPPNALDVERHELFQVGRPRPVSMSEMWKLASPFGPAAGDVVALTLANSQLNLMAPDRRREENGRLAAAAVLLADGGSILFRLESLFRGRKGPKTTFKLDWVALGMDAAIVTGGEEDHGVITEAVDMSAACVERIPGAVRDGQVMDVAEYVRGRFSLKWLNGSVGRTPAFLFTMQRIIEQLPHPLRYSEEELQDYLVDFLNEPSARWEIGLNFNTNSLFPPVTAHFRPFIRLQRTAGLPLDAEGDPPVEEKADGNAWLKKVKSYMIRLVPQEVKIQR